MARMSNVPKISLANKTMSFNTELVELMRQRGWLGRYSKDAGPECARLIVGKAEKDGQVFIALRKSFAGGTFSITVKGTIAKALNMSVNKTLPNTVGRLLIDLPRGNYYFYEEVADAEMIILRYES